MDLNGFGTCETRAAIVTALLISGGCSGTPTQPTTSTPSQSGITPPMIKTAPVITSLQISPRVEADDDVSLAATVEDADTPPDRLQYVWSVDPSHGAFIGSGREVTWRAPRGEHTPDVYVFTLTVIDSYMAGPHATEQRTSASMPVHYNDSHPETATLALDFLRAYANASVPADQVVRDFSDSCPGKATELQKVQTNRRDYQMVGGDFSVALTGLYENRTVGEIVAPCTFRSISKATGKTETTSGTCALTTVYENWRWMLCDSRFTARTPQ